MRSKVLARNPGIAHNSNPGTRLHINASLFIAHREGMVSTELVPYFMHYIINIEIIPLWNSISRRGKPTSFLIVNTNATDTAGIATTAGCAKKVADIIISGTDNRGQS